MTSLNRLIVVVAALLSPLGGVAAEPADAEALRAALKARDAAFDDALIRYTTWGEFGVKGFAAWKYPPNYAAEKLGIKEYGPQQVKFRYHEQMVVRGRDTTFTREADRDLKHEGDWTPAPFQKWSEVGEVVREISEVGNSTPPERIYKINKRENLSTITEQRMEVEFVHGFGFGKRIRTIDSIAREGKRRVLKGTIQIWTTDASTFQIELGDDLLVRKARIDTTVDGHLTRREVESKGAVERDGFTFAATGHFKKTVIGNVDQAKRPNGPRVDKEFSSRFDDARFDLPDAEYQTLIEFKISPVTQVNDYIKNTSYRIEKDRAITELHPPVAGDVR